jgi:hypothetical protein
MGAQEKCDESVLSSQLLVKTVRQAQGRPFAKLRTGVGESGCPVFLFGVRFKLASGTFRRDRFFNYPAQPKTGLEWGTRQPEDSGVR